MSIFGGLHNFLLGGYEDEENESEQPEEREMRVLEPVNKNRAAKAERPERTDNVTRLYPEATGCEIILSCPKNVDETSAVINNIRANNVCIVNLEGVEKSVSQRIADILGGASYYAGCGVERISNGIFVIAPNGVNISGRLKSEIKSDSMIFPWVVNGR